MKSWWFMQSVKVAVGAVRNPFLVNLARRKLASDFSEVLL